VLVAVQGEEFCAGIMCEKILREFCTAGLRDAEQKNTMDDNGNPGLFLPQTPFEANSWLKHLRFLQF
jgi:hypothetical protein